MEIAPSMPSYCGTHESAHASLLKGSNRSLAAMHSSTIFRHSPAKLVLPGPFYAPPVTR